MKYKIGQVVMSQVTIRPYLTKGRLYTIKDIYFPYLRITLDDGYMGGYGHEKFKIVGAATIAGAA